MAARRDAETLVAHDYCSRQLAAEACPYANICQQCDDYVTALEFIPQLPAQLVDITALCDDAAERGWYTLWGCQKSAWPVSCSDDQRQP